jgi:hypothetical protein
MFRSCRSGEGRNLVENEFIISLDPGLRPLLSGKNIFGGIFDRKIFAEGA